MRNIKLAFFLFVLMGSAPSVSAAIITYQYEGKEWDEIYIWEEGGQYYGDIYTNSTKRRTTGFITIDSSLLDNGMVDSKIVGSVYEESFGPIVDFGFYDGVTRWMIDWFYVHHVFSFKTDGNGDITDWFVVIGDGPTVDLELSSGAYNWPGEMPSNRTGDLIWTADGVDMLSYQPGTWTKVPEPGALVLLSFGLVTLVFLTRRKRDAARYY